MTIMNRSCFACLFVVITLSSCASDRWAPGDPDHKNVMHDCRGTIMRFDIPTEGDVVIWLKPDATDAYLLRPGQDELRCEIFASKRKAFESIFKRLYIGQVIETSGFWVVDHEEGGMSKLRPTTSVDIYPD